MKQQQKYNSQLCSECYVLYVCVCVCVCVCVYVHRKCSFYTHQLLLHSLFQAYANAYQHSF